MKIQIALLSLTTLLSSTAAFSPLSAIPATPLTSEHASRVSPLSMGRAAAVRAATKSKTDAKKAKTNAVYGKRIMMAVKQGGSPSTDSNRMLAEIVKQAKANNVPVDVSANKHDVETQKTVFICSGNICEMVYESLRCKCSFQICC